MGFHPMISASNIFNQIKNFDWWAQKYEEFFSDHPFDNLLPFFLEVRNDEWYDDHIEAYKKLTKDI